MKEVFVMYTDYINVKYSDVLAVHVYFDFKKIKKQYGITKRKEVLEVVNKEFDKVESMLCKQLAHNQNGYFAYMIWNDECTRIIGLSSCFYIYKKDYDKMAELLKEYEVKVV